ncbi:BURP domain-containing protein 3-like [Coffea eugenioides]|uniref:BURP domain-containing protein 3-like n=1 Tax=Coffea eugenioides TaxID=49369 RepID=UPI000F60F6F0|nr:BURP domain-containing protein 3-like [Coffea eugenioides]
MEFRPLHLFIFVALACVSSHAAQPAETYWKSVLPNSPMPKAIEDLIQSETVDDKSTSVGVSGGGVDVNAQGGNPGGTNVNAGHGGVDVNTPGGTNVNVGPGGVGVNTPGGTNVNVGPGDPGGSETQGRNPEGTDVNVGHGGGVTVSSGHHRGKPVYVGVRPGTSPFLYNYAATKDQLHDNPNVALFLLENNMTRGSKMNLHFFKTSLGATFLPRQVAESIPFSSNKMTEILNKFSVKPNSQEAEVMKNTIKECEKPGIQGEEKFCATSLEAMVDFTTSKLGKNVQAISTNSEKDTPLQKYTITGVKKMTNDKAVVCHQQNYAYAVFYCHKTQATRAYTLSLVGADGTKVKAVAVCHEDTTKWNPKHLAFKVLQIKPGQVPVCHFLPEDHVVWVPK